MQIDLTDYEWEMVLAALKARADALSAYQGWLLDPPNGTPFPGYDKAYNQVGKERDQYSSLYIKFYKEREKQR